MISPARFVAVVAASSFCLMSAAFGQKAVLSVDVKGADGRPAPNAQVRIDRIDKRMSPVMKRADTRGHIAVSTLEAGVYNLTAISAQGARSSQKIKVTATKPMLVTFNMSPAAAAPAQKKRYRWVETPTGTHMLGHWEEEDAPAGKVDSNGQPLEQVTPESLHRMGQGARLSAFHD